MRNIKAGISTPMPRDHWIVTHKIGQNVVVATAVLPQGHNLWEGRSIQQVNQEMRSKDTGPGTVIIVNVQTWLAAVESGH